MIGNIYLYITVIDVERKILAKNRFLFFQTNRKKGKRIGERGEDARLSFFFYSEKGKEQT